MEPSRVGAPHLLTSVIACMVACSTANPSPFFGDDRFLVVGVNPDTEADALAIKLAAHGLHERVRLRGATFTALGVEDESGALALVRVITARGIALALDPVESHALERGARYELRKPQVEGDFDADKDGFDDLLVVQHTYDGSNACLLAYRVQSSGFVDSIDDAQVVQALAGPAYADTPPCTLGAPDGGTPEAPEAVTPTPVL